MCFFMLLGLASDSAFVAAEDALQTIKAVEETEANHVGAEDMQEETARPAEEPLSDREDEPQGEAQMPLISEPVAEPHLTYPDKENEQQMDTVGAFSFSDIDMSFAESALLSEEEPEDDQSISVDICLDKTAIVIGQKITASWSISGAVERIESFSSVWRVYEQDDVYALKGFSNKNTFGSSLIPVSGVKCCLVITIHDTEGVRIQQVSDFVEIINDYPPTPMNIDIRLDKASIGVGEKLTASWTVRGVHEPYQSFSCVWHVVDVEGTPSLTGYTTKVCSTSSFIPTSGGKCRLGITIFGADGREIEAYSEYVSIEPGLILISSITLNKTTHTLSPGESFNLTAGILPEDAADTSLRWSSSHPMIADVDQNGEVTALQEGNAFITARANDSGGAEARCLVTVAGKLTFLSVDRIADQVYTGEAIEPAFVLKDGDRVLSPGSDYALEFSNNIRVGTAGVTIIGKGLYEGTREVSFSIIKAEYDMGKAAWDYATPFIYDGSEKAIGVTGLPEGVSVQVYTDNRKTQAGRYRAEVTFDYDEHNYNGPYMTGQIWEILPVLQAPVISSLSSTPYAVGLTISWKPVEHAKGYVLERALSPKGPFKQLYRGPNTSYINAGLGDSKLYYYRVSAYMSSLGFDHAGPFGAVKAGAAIAASASPKAEILSKTSLKLTWSAVKNAKGYQLYRASEPDGAYTRVYSGTGTSYTNKSLASGKVYYYKLRVYKTIEKATYYSAYSAVRPAVALAAPSAPKLTAESGTAIKASWTSVAGATGYQLYRAASEKGSYSRVYSGTEKSYINTGLTAGKVYYYKLRAYVKVGGSTIYGPYSAVKMSVPLAAPKSLSAPAADGKALKIAWGASGGATGYQLYRATSETGSYTKVYAGTARSYTNTGLKTGTVYYYKARAYKTVGKTTYYSPYSEVKTGVPLAAPSKLSATIVSGTEVKASWPASTGATGYQLYRAASEKGNYTGVYSGTDKSYTDSGLKTGTAYYYKVRSYMTIGTVTYYSPYSAVKGAVALAAPGSLSFTPAKGTSIKIAWPAVSGAGGYELYRASSEAGNYTRVYAGTSRSYVDPSGGGKKVYYYKLRAYKTVGGAKNYGPYSAAQTR